MPDQETAVAEISEEASHDFSSTPSVKKYQGIPSHNGLIVVALGKWLGVWKTESHCTWPVQFSEIIMEILKYA